MKNYVHDGETLALTLTEEAHSGRPVLIGDIFGVAVTDGKVGQSIAVTIEGAFILQKTTGAIAQGDKVYWQRAQVTPPKEEGVTKTPDGNKLVGVAAMSAGPADQAIMVRLNGSF